MPNASQDGTSSGAKPVVTDPLVSVVMPVFNSAQHIDGAVESLEAQTHTSWECVIVDDGSTDASPTLLEGLSVRNDRIRIIRQRNAGPAIARNTALAAALGEYVQFLDADDVLHPRKLSDHVAALEARPAVDVLYGPTAYFDDGSPEELRQGFRSDDRLEPTRIGGRGRPVVDILLERNVLTIEAPLVRRVVFDEVGVFDRHLRRITDWQFWLRCALEGKSFEFVDSDYPVASIRVHRSSLSYDDTVMHEAEIEMRRSLARTLTDPGLRSANDQALARAKAAVGIDKGLQGDILEGLRLLLPTVHIEHRASRATWALALLASPIPSVRSRLIERRYGWRSPNTRA